MSNQEISRQTGPGDSAEHEALGSAEAMGAGADAKPDMKSPFSAVPIEITISVGRARPLIRDLLALKKHSVLPLDRRVDDAVELYVGERLIARGQLEELEGDAQGQLAVRLTEVAQMQDGLE